MIRRSIVGAATLVAVVILALPASAKGIRQARFTGPGLPKGGITITGDHGPLEGLGTLTDPGLKSARPFSGATGPAYRVTLVFDFAPGQPVHQVLYPYAAGGPRTYTPPNQGLGGSFLDIGWYQGSPDLLPFLIRSGFPAHAPLVAPDGSPSSPTATSWPAWAWVLVAMAMGGVLLLVAARQRRRVVA